MVTVTFPIRAAAAPPPERTEPAPAAAGGAAFEALFAQGQPPSAPPDRTATNGEESAVPAAPAPEDTPTAAETEREGAEPPDTLVAVPALLVPPPGPEGVLVLANLPAGDPPETAPGPVPAVAPVAPSGVEAAVAALAIPAATGMPAAALLAAAQGAAAQGAAARASGPANPPVPAGADAADAAAPSGAVEGAPVETGLFILAAEPGAVSGKSALPSGMPAFWAAREAAGAEASVLETPAPADQMAAPAPSEGAAGVPHEMPKAATAAAPGKGAEKPPRPEAAAPPATAPAQTAPAPESPEAAPAAGPAGPQAAAPALQQVLPALSALPQMLLPQMSLPQMPLAPGPAPQSPVPVLPPQLPAQIAAEISARPERPLELRLAPAELGGLTLNLRQDGDILRVVLQAERPDTLDLLRRNGDILLEELRLEGFAGASLSFADGGGAQERRDPSGMQAALAGGDMPGHAAPVAAHDFRPAPAAQGLDLRL